MTELAQDFLAWTQAHPGWALCLLFAAAALDAVFVIGVMVPAGPVLFALGALVALDVVDFWVCVSLAALGAYCGDGFSFWLGRRYGPQLFASPWLARRQAVIEGAQRFFDQHGGKGVLIGRFLGPLRAVLATVAGASGMRLWVFLLVDAVAVWLWALAFILPGVVFGASLGLAAEVAGRLALMIALLAFIGWGAFFLTRVLLAAASRYGERWIGRLLDLSRRYRRVGLFGAALADPKQPETPVLAVLAVALWLAGGLALFLVSSPWLHAYPWPSDAAVYQWLRELHTPYGLSIATVLLHLGEWPVYGPVAAAVLVSLILQRRARAAAHWVAALGFGAVLSIGLSLIPTLPPPYDYFGHPRPPGYSERDLVLAIIVYGFLPVVLGTRQPAAWRGWCYGLSATLISLIVASRLYVGAHWASHVLIDLVIGLVWTAFLGLGLRRHRPVAVGRLVTVAPAFAALAVALLLQLSLQPGLPPPGDAPDAALDRRAWLAEGYRGFPTQRTDVAGRPKQPLNLQWAGELDAIRARLLAEGWEPPAELGGGQMLRWLSPRAPVGLLPVLPQVHAGERQALFLRRPLSDDQQLALRLWPSGVRLTDGTPLWLGTLVVQEARAAYGGLLRYPIGVALADPQDWFPFAAPQPRNAPATTLLSTPPLPAEDLHE